jgi:hypothetical protein
MSKKTVDSIEASSTPPKGHVTTARINVSWLPPGPTVFKLAKFGELK